jgi:hypothetical protein
MKKEKKCLSNDEIYEITSYMQSMMEDWIENIPLGEDKTAIELFDDFGAYLLDNWNKWH